MVKRITVTLEQDEYSALLGMAIDDLRNPADELRYLLRLVIEKRALDPTTNNKIAKEYLTNKGDVLK